ncbi:hypothetical protein [Hoylesella oralis]|uniref:hypothetical protein n=1 Tax=Hoylesella oralis TaxID=28134 RepID=UPI0028E34C52|nr:hypothetical protein [Hoylesella oralis]
MKKVIERVESGVITLLIFPFDTLEPIEIVRGCFCLDKVMAALVRLRYSQDRVEAILCNYIGDPKDAQFRKEFDELQAYRAQCKTEAASIVQAYQDEQKPQ